LVVVGFSDAAEDGHAPRSGVPGDPVLITIFLLVGLLIFLVVLVIGALT
jgi:hypothetical protein